MKNENTVRLRHILDAISQIQDYVDGFDETKFGEDRKTQDAVIRQLEIIGEASKNLTGELRQANPQIPWKQASGIRDRLAHGYFNIKLSIVHTVILILSCQLFGKR